MNAPGFPKPLVWPLGIGLASWLLLFVTGYLDSHHIEVKGLGQSARHLFDIVLLVAMLLWPVVTVWLLVGCILYAWRGRIRWWIAVGLPLGFGLIGFLLLRAGVPSMILPIG